MSLAFGLTVLTMAYAIGHISGCHLNPAVTVGLIVGKRFDAKEAPAYIVAQVLGAVLAGFVLYAIAQGAHDAKPLTDSAGVFATNGYGYNEVAATDGTKSVTAGSPKGYTLVACLLAEVVLTAIFLFVILGSTDSKRGAPPGFAPIAIGLCLTLIHLIGIPVTNLSVNPARSTGPAVVTFVNGVTGPMTQLWLFWVAPIAGAMIGAILYGVVTADEKPIPAA